MSLPNPAEVVDELPRALRPAFAPLKKNAMGFALAAATGLAFTALAVHGILTGPSEARWVWLLGDNFFPGYKPTVLGTFIGLGWGVAAGFVMGWFIAGLRNFTIAVWMMCVGAREQLRANSEFLDEI